ncbi:MAG: hypothetical protein PQJ58_03120 [Spirochaetales bacterium]|nr:hypothetical protein [Spirochaetales bacterium]
MKIKLILLLCSSLFFTSCIDIFHTVSLNNGRAEVTVRYTIQKAILEMGSSFSGEEMDYSEFTEMGEEMFGEYRGISGEIIPIDNSFHIGAEVRIKGAIKTIKKELQNENLEFLPTKTKNGYEILIPGMGDEEADETALAFISGSRYILLVDLSGDLKDITKARLKFEDESLDLDKENEILVNIYGSSMVIEIPMAYLFMSSESFAIELS